MTVLVFEKWLISSLECCLPVPPVLFLVFLVSSMFSKSHLYVCLVFFFVKFICSSPFFLCPLWNPDRFSGWWVAITISSALDVDDATMSNNSPKRHVEEHSFTRLLHYIFIPFKFVQELYNYDTIIISIKYWYRYMFAANKIQIVHTEQTIQKVMCAFCGYCWLSEHKSIKWLF